MENCERTIYKINQYTIELPMDLIVDISIFLIGMIVGILAVGFYIKHKDNPR
jgi:hypothetical protein